MLPPVLLSQPISIVLVNSWATASGWFCAYFFISRFGLERLFPLLYKSNYTDMSIADQRSFAVHHLWLIIKLSALSASGAYIHMLRGPKGLFDPFMHGSSITNADYLSVIYMSIIAGFLWEISSASKSAPSRSSTTSRRSCSAHGS